MLEKFVAYQLAKVFYDKCKLINLPPYLQDQLLRASSSIAMNLTEGSGRVTIADQSRFYAMALGSLRECEAILNLENIKDEEAWSQARRLGAIIFVLTKKKYLTERQKNPKNPNPKP